MLGRTQQKGNDEEIRGETMRSSIKRLTEFISVLFISTFLTACNRGNSSSGAGSGFTNDNIISSISLSQLTILLIVAIIIVIPFWKITERAGYSGWFSLLILIPGINLVYVYFLGFSNWPSLKKDQ